MSKVRRPRPRKQGPKLHPITAPARNDTPAGSRAIPEVTVAEAPVTAAPVALIAEAPTPLLDGAEPAAPEPAARESLPEAAAEMVASQDDVPPLALASAPMPVPFIPQPVPPQLGAESLGTTVMNYVIGEGEALAAYWRALAGARSMAEVVRLQIGEFQRAADATLTCWGVLTLAASRTVAPR
jgi:hypothetical protein